MIFSPRPPSFLSPFSFLPFFFFRFFLSFFSLRPPYLSDNRIDFATRSKAAL